MTAFDLLAVDAFGGCPECGRSDGYLNVGSAHWFFCEAHKIKWCIGENIFSSWRNEATFVWECNQAKLSTYRQVPELHNPLWRLRCYENLKRRIRADRITGSILHFCPHAKKKITAQCVSGRFHRPL